MIVCVQGIQLHGHRCCRRSIRIEPLHKDTELLVAVHAPPGHGKRTFVAQSGDLRVVVFEEGCVWNQQLNSIGAGFAAIGCELLHVNAVVVFWALRVALPSDHKLPSLAKCSDLGNGIGPVGPVQCFQLHHSAALDAVGIELLHKDAVVVFAVAAIPSDDIFARIAHSGDLGGKICTVGLVQTIQLDRLGRREQFGCWGLGVVGLRFSAGGVGRGIAGRVAPSGAHAHAEVVALLARWRCNDHGEDLARFTFHRAGHQGALAAVVDGDVVRCEVRHRLAEGEGVGHRAGGRAAGLVIGDGQGGGFGVVRLDFGNRDVGRGIACRVAPSGAHAHAEVGTFGTCGGQCWRCRG